MAPRRPRDDPDDVRRAAVLALPGDAHLTGISRLQHAGLDHGPRTPVRFVVARDHHLVVEGVFLHRTKKLPALDAEGVTVPMAFVAYCARARTIDAVKVGDWLLREHLTTIDELTRLGLAEPWRAGALETVWVLDHLDAASRSLKESETRAILDFAGLVGHEVNAVLEPEPGLEVVADLLYRREGVLVEFEGGHHQTTRAQYTLDIDRYALLRAHHLAYVQVTKEKLGHPRSLVGEIYRALVGRGYAGAVPQFGEQWRQLFLPLTAVVGPRRDRASSLSS